MNGPPCLIPEGTFPFALMCPSAPPLYLRGQHVLRSHLLREASPDCLHLCIRLTALKPGSSLSPTLEQELLESKDHVFFHSACSSSTGLSHSTYPGQKQSLPSLLMWLTEMDSQIKMPMMKCLYEGHRKMFPGSEGGSQHR